MPTIQVRPENGVIVAGDFELPLSAITTLAPVDATGKALKLQDARVQFKAKPTGCDTEVTYTVAIVVTREPIDETESARISTKAAEQKARKDDKEAKELATRERDLKRAEQSGRDGVLGVMGQVGQIAQAAHVLAALAGK